MNKSHPIQALLRGIGIAMIISVINPKFDYKWWGIWVGFMLISLTCAFNEW